MVVVRAAAVLVVRAAAAVLMVATKERDGRERDLRQDKAVRP